MGRNNSHKEWKEIVAIATPVVISKLSFTFMGLVDTAMVGRLGPSEQAAVGIATTYMFTLYVLGLGIIGVVNTLVAQYTGAGQPERCGAVLQHGLRLATAMAALTWLALFYSRPLFHLAGLSESVCRFGYGYLMFRIVGLFGVFWYWTYNAFLEGLGRTRTAMWIIVAGNLFNIGADYALIFGLGPVPAMGVEGAGLATGLANLFIFGCFAGVVHRRSGPYREGYGLGTYPAPVEWPLLGRMLRLGFPMGAQFFLEVGAYLVFSVLVGWVSDTALAANQVALRVMSISFMTAFGIGTAATTLVGQHQGERRSDLAKAAGRRSVILMVGYSLACGVLFVAAPRMLAGVFTTAGEVIDTTVSLLYVAALFQIFDGVNMVGYSALKGAGDTEWPLWVVAAVHWCLGIPLVYTLTILLGYGALGTWIGMCAMMLVQAGLILYRFESGKWTSLRLVESPGTR